MSTITFLTSVPPIIEWSNWKSLYKIRYLWTKFGNPHVFVEPEVTLYRRRYYGVEYCEKDKEQVT